MPTEDFSDDQARQLLANAAATIEVDETAPMTLTGLPEPRPRRWPVLAAAAGVVLAIGGGYLVAQQLGDDPQPAPVVDKTDAADREPVEQEHLYADDEMPSLLGYTENEATRLLQSRGYALEVSVEYSCDQPAGYVLDTDPGPGTRMGTGDSVRVRVTGGQPPNANCIVATDVWQQVLDLARFARGLGPPPAFADEVSIAVGEEKHLELAADEAADPESWVQCAEDECHSPLAALRQILTTPAKMRQFFESTFLVVTEETPVQGCLTGDPYEQAFPYHLPTYVYVDHPKDFISLCPPAPVLQIGWTEDWRIADVRLRLGAEDPGGEDPTEPATERKEAAEAFVNWARGKGPAPEFPDRVRVMFGGGGAFGSTGWVDEPENRTLYSGCSGLGFPDCRVDPVAVIANYDGPVVATTGRTTCADGGEVPERFAEAETDVVRLEEPEPASCRSAWAIELWIDEDGVIYGVNQAGAFMSR